MELIDRLGTEPVIVGNVSSGMGDNLLPKLSGQFFLRDGLYLSKKNKY